MSDLATPWVARGRRVGVFVRYLVEMTVAMMIGMAAYGALAGGLLALGGGSLEEARLEHPEPVALGMALAMSAPMVAWMRHRGHRWRSGVEMSAAMVVPVLALIACYRADAVSADAVCPLACAAMIPAMIVVMLWRHADYAGDPLR